VDFGRLADVSEPERLNYKHYQKAAREAKNKHLEVKLEKQLADRGITDYEREFRFNPERRHRADFCWPGVAKLIVEVEGGTRSGGRHVRPDGFEKDAEKYNLATILGYAVLRFTSKQVHSGEAAETIETYLRYYGERGRATC
jgi:very-short-patch-repair endonuclease